MQEINYNKIKLLILDVDGVLTDGRIFLTERGEEMFLINNARDASGLKTVGNARN